MGKRRPQEASLNPPGIRFQNRDKGWKRFNAGVYQRDLNRDKRKRLIEQQAERRYQHRIDGLDKEYARRPGHIVNDLSSFHHHLRQIREIRIQKHNLGNLSAGVASVRHRYRAVRFPERQKIVDAVACHGYLTSLPL